MIRQKRSFISIKKVQIRQGLAGDGWMWNMHQKFIKYIESGNGGKFRLNLTAGFAIIKITICGDDAAGVI